MGQAVPDRSWSRRESFGGQRVRHSLTSLSVKTKLSRHDVSILGPGRAGFGVQNRKGSPGLQAFEGGKVLVLGTQGLGTLLKISRPRGGIGATVGVGVRIVDLRLATLILRGHERQGRKTGRVRRDTPLQ